MKCTAVRQVKLEVSPFIITVKKTVRSVSIKIFIAAAYKNISFVLRIAAVFVGSIKFAGIGRIVIAL